MASGLPAQCGSFSTCLLKGAKPDDLPVEEVSQLKLVVNLKTAKALGVTFSESILLRADELIR